LKEKHECNEFCRIEYSSLRNYIASKIINSRLATSQNDYDIEEEKIHKEVELNKIKKFQVA